MRSAEEIIKYIEDKKSEDLFNVILYDCAKCLSFEAARRYLNEDVTADAWDVFCCRSDKDIINEIISYLPFAYNKAENERGLSAIRSINHMQAWFYCLGDDDMTSKIEKMLTDDYAPYGMPILKEIEKWLRDKGHLKGELEKYE